MSDNISKTNIKGVLVINRPLFPDDRGFFKETFRKNELEEQLDEKFEIVQENHSRSQKLTLRGIHAAPWNKFVYCVDGKVQVVIADFREDSETFGQHFSLVIGEDNRSKIFVPKGCGNSFLVLSNQADIMYLTDSYWQNGKEFGVCWDDPDLAIDWHLNNQKPLLSEKDRINPKLRQHFPSKFND